MPDPAKNSSPAIEVQNLTRRYGAVVAVADISFRVEQGEIVGFLGPNGAGKSTTMRILTGCLPATSGRATVAGFPVATEPLEVRRRLGYMPENNPLPEDMRVREYLHLRAALKGISGRAVRAAVDEALERCDLRRVASRIIATLSKGYRQRVGIAEAIVAQPEVVILDEPTIGLDPHQIVLIRDLIGSLRGRMAVMISSHILPEIEVTCDRVIIINGGHIAAAGSPIELRRSILGCQRVVVDTSGDPARIEELARSVEPTFQLASPPEPGPDGFRRLVLRTTATGEVGEALLAALVREPGLRLRSFAPEHPSLEEVFMTATRRSWDVVTPAGRRPGQA